VYFGASLEHMVKKQEQTQCVFEQAENAVTSKEHALEINANPDAEKVHPQGHGYC